MKKWPIVNSDLVILGITSGVTCGSFAEKHKHTHTHTHTHVWFYVSNSTIMYSDSNLFYIFYITAENLYMFVCRSSET